MSFRVAALIVAGVLGVGCSSNGTSGPQGPAGPRGETGSTGVQGSPGQAGVSVTSVSLPLGSLECANGGSQFTSLSGTTFACNGADGASGSPGVQGPPGAVGATGPRGPAGATGPIGPRGLPGVAGVVAWDSTGNRIGTIVNGFPSEFAAIHVDSSGLLWYVEASNSRISLGYPWATVAFRSADCTGTPYYNGSDVRNIVLPVGTPSGEVAYFVVAPTSVEEPFSGLSWRAVTHGLVGQCQTGVGGPNLPVGVPLTPVSGAPSFVPPIAFSMQ
jgi:hypothetical protein